MHISNFLDKLSEDKVKEIVMCGTKRTKETKAGLQMVGIEKDQQAA